MHDHPPRVSHFQIFRCKCFILKKGKLDKFEAHSSDGSFLGFAIHSRAYRVLNLEANQIMETCEVTFDETMPCSSSAFECAGDEEMAQTIFEDKKEDDDEDDEDQIPNTTRVHSTTTRVSPTTTRIPLTTTRVPSTSTTMVIDDGPSPTLTSTHQQEARVEATNEGEVVSRREVPR